METYSYRSLYLDMQDGESGPRRGDYVVSVGKRGIGTIYLVILSRQVKRKDPKAAPRFTMTVRKVENMKPGKRVIELTWYPRRKKTFEQYMRRGI